LKRTEFLLAILCDLRYNISIFLYQHGKSRKHTMKALRQKDGLNMDNISKEKLAQTMATVHDFKQLSAEKGSKEATVNYLLQETGLTKDECETAYDFYNGIQLP
jgi:hypothetical protein